MEYGSKAIVERNKKVLLPSLSLSALQWCGMRLFIEAPCPCSAQCAWRVQEATTFYSYDAVASRKKAMRGWDRVMCRVRVRWKMSRSGEEDGKGRQEEVNATPVSTGRATHQGHSLHACMPTP